jgi:hypothetical protein
MHVDELRAGSGWLRKVLRPPFASALRVLMTPKTMINGGRVKRLLVGRHVVPLSDEPSVTTPARF